MSDVLSVRGAAEHNLRDIDLDLPKNRLIVFTGLSGSGKSSLAFDTLFAEGQRLYVESLSTYARQFLQQLPRPKVRRIEGLAPAVAIHQAGASHNPRSTVATMTEIYDHLRVLYAAIGVPHCPRCGREVGAQSRESIIEAVVEMAQRGPVDILAPLVRGRRGEFQELFPDLRRQGYARARVDGQTVRLDSPPRLDRYRRHDIEVVVDRLGRGTQGGPGPTEEELRARVAEAVEAALDRGEGDLIASREGQEDALLSRQFACSACRVSFTAPTHASFSFNSPRGMCPTCEGLGIAKQFDAQLLIAHPERSLRAGAIPLLGSMENARRRHIYEGVARHFGFTVDTPLGELDECQLYGLLYGSDGEIVEFHYKHPRRGWEWRHAEPFEGIIPMLMDRYKRSRSWFLRHEIEKAITEQLCPACGGDRLRPESLAVTVGGLSIAQVVGMSARSALGFISELKLTGAQAQIAEDALREIRARLEFLVHMGLDYLALSRTAPTLAGGESQRIRLAAQVGSGLTNCLYVLDEPSIGLHHRDQGRLLESLQRLRDMDNTVIVVEHDEQTIRSADWVVDFGPGAGHLGGEVIAQGRPSAIARAPGSLTGRYLSGKATIPVPATRRVGNGKTLTLYKVHRHNLRNVDVAFPLGLLICVTGVSGSGKSSLVSDTLQPALARELQGAQRAPGSYERIEGLEHLRKAILIDQSPIGRTPRSNPATYTKLFDHIRTLFAKLPESRARGYAPGRFSFNVASGRCAACEGHGAVRLESDFLAEVWVECEQCEGRRYDRETLGIHYKGASIFDVLDMEVSEALGHFGNLPPIRRILQTLEGVGLGYIKLGQSATTLSGGEAQRVKLARELARPSNGDCIYILDEPTTGLHFEDVRQLLEVLQRLVDSGDTVVVVEHHPDVIKVADHVIDLGPEGGDNGGRVVATGTPEQIAMKEGSHTGAMLRELFGMGGGGSLHGRVGSQRRSSRARATHIEARGARQHNLKNISVRIPRGIIAAFSGVSGSGKTSLALDTIYAEGQRRFVETLSPYARQFVSQMPKPKVERVSGLSPAIAIDPRNSVVTPRSTVGTVTEVYDYLRVLYARLGQQRCPSCRAPLGAASVADIVDRVIAQFGGRQTLLLAPVRPTGAEEYATVLDRLQREGWSRARVDGEVHRLPLRAPIDRRMRHDVAIVVDRLSPERRLRSRIAEAVEAALRISEGSVVAAAAEEPNEEMSYATDLTCPSCGGAYERLTPRDYSFNHYEGWCAQCEGLGVVKAVDLRIVVPDEGRSIRQGAISVLGPLERGSLLERLMEGVGRRAGFSLDVPFGELGSAQRAAALEGSDLPVTLDGLEVRYRGILPALGRARQYERYLGALRERAEMPCPRCGGGRLDEAAAATAVRGRTLPELCQLPLTESLRFLSELELDERERQRAAEALQEIVSRLRFLCEVGLDYLTLHREAMTLSGGEAQRVKLATQLGAGLTGVTYVLDEPTVGIHPADNERMLRALRRLRDLGNSVLVVEHDPQTLRAADHIVDFGPGAGPAGGEVVAQGSPDRLPRRSLTGQYLRGARAIAAPARRRPLPDGDDDWLTVEGVTHHNLKGITARIPLGALTCITGPSGSGKSSLVNEVLYPELAWRLHGQALTPGHFRALRGAEGLARVITIDQSPIGQSPRSNPATYVGVFDLVRRFFGMLPAARIRGFTAERFSFNRPGGRCEACQGMGAVCVQMHFLPDVWVMCEECGGRRYNAETLQVRYQGKTVSDVLDLSVGEATKLFESHPRLHRMLQVMGEVGLDYLQLGQPAPSLSSGEAQRVKLARELARPVRGHTLYLLDEPTTGLHLADIERLLAVLDRLVEAGNSVVVIEHNLDVIKTADWVLDLGPTGGERGGYLVACGRPEEVAETGASPIAPYLRTVLEASPRRPRAAMGEKHSPRPAPRAAQARDERALAPWETDGRAWHHTRAPERGGPRKWDPALLDVVVEACRTLQPEPEVRWDDARTVTVTAPRAEKPFLRMLTYEALCLNLRFYTAKGVFDAARLDADLALPPWTEVEGVHRYTNLSRVRVYTRAPGHDMVAIEAHSASDVTSAAFGDLVRRCWDAYLALVGKGVERCGPGCRCGCSSR